MFTSWLLEKCCVFVVLSAEIHQTEAKLLAQLAGDEMKKEEKSRQKNGYDQHVAFNVS